MDSGAAKALRNYLRDLRAALSSLPRDRRDEVVEDIRLHVTEAAGPDPTEAAVRNAIERTGEPSQLASEAGAPPPAPLRFGAAEVFAVVLLAIGGFFAFVGWFIGVALLWTSRGWLTWEKVLGTVAPPGGLLTAYWLMFIGMGPDESCVTKSGFGPGEDVTTCTGGGGELADTLIAIGAVLAFAAAFLVPVFLVVRLRRRVAASRQKYSV